MVGVCDEEALDRFLAQWVLGRATPEEAVQFATRALEAGCSDLTVAVIAGSDATTRTEVETALARLLRARDKRLPSADEALKVLVDDCARKIARGEVDPVRGAWAMWSFWANEADSPRFFGQVRAFIDLASECDDPGPHVGAYRAAIVEAAERFLAGGGLRLPL
jgi:hypothetical protein